MIIKSPGISNEHFLIEQAKILKIPIVTDLEFFYSFYPHKKYITITGSNGKTTTVTLTHEILKMRIKNIFWVVILVFQFLIILMMIVIY